jgi:hypothetical protein
MEGREACRHQRGDSSETDFVFVLYRTQLFNPDDIETVKKIQAGYEVQTLSQFLGKPAPAAPPAVDFMKPLAVEAERTSLQFFNELNFILQFYPTHPSEQALMQRFAKIGVGAGKSIDANALSPEMRKALEDGMADAWKAFGEFKETQIDTGKSSSADSFGTRAYLKNDYMLRMSAAILGIYGNSKDEAFYPAYFVDSERRKLDGANLYTMRFAKFNHRREPASLDNQTVIRLNRDTLYSGAVFDLDAGLVTITMPDAGKRFMSMAVINEDHYVAEVDYGAGTRTLTKDKVGTRYVAVAVRTLVDPIDPGDVEQVHKLQDAIKVSQDSIGKFEVPNWDQAGQKKVRDALLILATTIPDFKRAFGTREQVDPVRHLIATAAGWGGNPDKDATYLNVTPANNDGTTVYKLDVKDVPVDAFWSISLYNADGYFQKNEYNAYSVNNITAKKGTDGSVAVQFGSCDGKIPNCLPIMKGWNYTVRLYRPRAEILDGTWKFPEARPVT